MSSLLKKAYDPEQFRKQAHTLVDTLANYLDESIYQKKERVFRQFEPDELFKNWQNRLGDPKQNDFSTWSKRVVDDSIHLHNPGYMGHQVSPVLPQAALADLMSALLNNGMGVYEMGSPAVAMERVVIKHLAERIGFDDKAEGVLTSGGTLGNLTALLTARQLKVGGDVWNEGTGGQQLGIMVSEEAHYSISRAVKILGWGEEGIIKVPVDEHFRLDPSKLEETFQKASKNGIEIIGAVGSSCSTATGSFDPLPELADFCENHKLWFHVDAAHGGAALYSKKHRTLLQGIDRADSVIVDFHKMLMCPALVTGLVFKEGDHSYQTFAQKAEYLWKQEGEEWFNLGKRTFECTKDMMSLKVYSLLHIYGTKLFKENVEQLFEMGKAFGNMVSDHPRFELLIKPQSNIVCFRYVSGDIEDLNMHNERLKRQLIKEEKYFIVQTNVRGELYLRTAIMNPFTTCTHLKGLLDRLEDISQNTLV
jgi:L-2,4-diaminobutyrate decarboxylase